MEMNVNPWNVTDLDDFLFYCCPECDTKHVTKDVFQHHALKEHQNAREILVPEETEYEIKEESEFLDLDIDLPLDNETCDFKDSEEIKIEPRPKRNCSTKSEVIKVDKEGEEDKSDSEPEHDLDFEPGVNKSAKSRTIQPKKKLKIKGKYKCEECEKSYKNHQTLKIHVATEHNLMCTKCEMVFASKEHIIDHRKTCQNYQTCKTCGEKFDGFYLLKKHLKKNHPDEHSQAQCQTCELCGKVLGNIRNLKIHLLSVHNVGELPPDKRIINCSRCDKEFKSAVTMDEHFKTQCHDNDKTECQNIEFNCKFCSTKWNSHLSLELHIMEIHMKRMFSCDQCNYISHKREPIQRHIDLVHKQLRNRVCHHCGKAFTLQQYLRVHLRKKHNEGPPIERKYRCDQCDKSYENPKNLKIHKATNHQKNVSYPCPICSKTFLHKQYLQQHVKHVHEKYRPKKCDLCPEAFLTNRDFKKHKEKHGIYD